MRRVRHFGALLFLASAPLSSLAQTIPSSGTATSPNNSICGIIDTVASANALPVDFFVRVIWQESRFQPDVIGPLTHSGEHALGIAQFMPGTAVERKLFEPFNPALALPKSGEFLAELRTEFGNLGLAAAAYNAGPQRVRDFLAGLHDLPSETRHYVLAITGHSVDEWAQSAETSKIETHSSSDRGAPARCHDVVASLAERSSDALAIDIPDPNVPSWCRHLHHPNTSVCGRVHEMSFAANTPIDAKLRGHTSLIRASSSH